MCQAPFPDLAKENVHIASVTVKKVVQADEDDPERIADIFWKLHQQPRSAWTWEESYEYAGGASRFRLQRSN